MIYLTRRQYEDMVAYSRKELPNEACGLLAGSRKGRDKVVERIYFLANIDRSREHFSMDAEEQFKAIAHSRANGWELLGNFHSHPATPSRPSEEDKRLAFDPRLSYFILSLREEDQPVLKSFQIAAGYATEEEFIIVEEELEFD